MSVCMALPSDFVFEWSNIFKDMHISSSSRGRGGKTTSGYGQAWISPSLKGKWRTGKKWRKLVVKLSAVPQ